MNNKLYSVLGILLISILFLGLAVAGGLAIAERDSKLTKEQADALIEKGIVDFKSTEMICNKDYCTFWVTKEDVVNKQISIQATKQFCDEKTKVCSMIPKTEQELVSERNKIADDIISSVANKVIEEKAKTVETKVSVDEVITIRR